MSTVESVTAELNSQAVVLFVSSHCPYCKKATEELAANGFSAKVIEANPSHLSQPGISLSLFDEI
jgi:hypothetical protein